MVLISNEDIGTALKKACEGDSDMDAVHLAEAAKLVRTDMLKMKSEFSGTFEAQCQENSLPVSLLLWCCMVQISQPKPVLQICLKQLALNFSQLLMYNCLVNQSKASTTTKHSQS